jgi:murein L,D-transpeptidase YafK
MGESAASTEGELDQIFAALDHSRLDQALKLTDRLIAQHPNFKLAYLIRGDLLLAHTSPITTIGNAPNASEDSLKDLREEAIVRLRAYRDRPASNMFPRDLLQLRADQHSAVVVDTMKSRLYVYGNDHGRPRFLADYYITQGKLGADKEKEGDQKTPVGVYRITSRLPKRKLAAIYGDAALPIDYPNEWDRLNGRTGHGIWLHGTPSDTYSRPPKASDGCVVLSNPDLQALIHSVQIGVTPVIISDHVEWLKIDEWNAQRSSLQHALENWREDWESRDIDRYLSHYSKRFSSDTEALRQWSSRKRQVNAGKEWVQVRVGNVAMLRYPGNEDMVVVTFDQNYRSNNMSNSVQKTQYWVRENNRWKIVYEGVN